MKKRVILLADNNEDSLEVYREILVRAGYTVVPAANLDEATRALERCTLDAAVLDLRLRDDEDEKDVSGVILAREKARSIPTIILTGFPDVYPVCEALRPMLDGVPAAIDFVEKESNSELLLNAIERALETARVNGRAHRDVFIVHGHELAARAVVDSFIRELGLNPIILCEKPGEGRAILQQIEHYSEVGFVVVLLTPDDVGYVRESPKEKKPRARQNVIFELGFFIGKLGTDRVRCLYRPGVEIPSDYQGVIYIPLDDSDGWKLRLAREMHAAGVAIDFSKLMPEVR